MYTPEICDGDFCQKECDGCPNVELIIEREEEKDGVSQHKDTKEFCG